MAHAIKYRRNGGSNCNLILFLTTLGCYASIPVCARKTGFKSAEPSSLKGVTIQKISAVCKLCKGTNEFSFTTQVAAETVISGCNSRKLTFIFCHPISLFHCVNWNEAVYMTLFEVVLRAFCAWSLCVCKALKGIPPRAFIAVCGIRYTTSNIALQPPPLLLCNCTGPHCTTRYTD